MATKSAVALVPCDNYDPGSVESALKQALDLIGGLARFVKPGEKVLIKPNALMGASPEAAVTTHPAVIAAVVKEVVKAGARALVGDSPGNSYAYVPQTMEKSGIRQAVAAAGGEMIYFQQGGVVEVDNPGGNPRMKKIKISRRALEADLIINLPKLKTHNLTGYTGAVKNLFGVVPGFHKTGFHAAAPNPKELAELLIDVYEVIKPALNIMDGIIGMEGTGPSNGRPRKLGAILASSDGVALDALASYLIGFEPSEIDTTRRAGERRLGEADLKKIEMLGVRPDEFRQADWQRPRGVYRLSRWLPDFFFNLARPVIENIKIDPEINQSKCTKCLVCVRNCPAKTIHYHPAGKKVEIDLTKCIHCFCCHELCEYNAVNLNSSWLTRVLGI